MRGVEQDRSGHARAGLAGSEDTGSAGRRLGAWTEGGPAVTGDPEGPHPGLPRTTGNQQVSEPGSQIQGGPRGY